MFDKYKKEYYKFRLYIQGRSDREKIWQYHIYSYVKVLKFQFSVEEKTIIKDECFYSDKNTLYIKVEDTLEEAIKIANNTCKTKIDALNLKESIKTEDFIKLNIGNEDVNK